MRIDSKSKMYRMLDEGAFGNTIEQYFDADHWFVAAPNREYWGVRTLTTGGPCRLYCPENEVLDTVESFMQQGHKVNISEMIDAFVRVTLWADVYDAPGGLLVYGIENPPRGASWRKLMPTVGREWRGVQATMLLKKHLNACSLDDLDALRYTYPGHVYELSACEGCVGRIPHRNAVMWEVRVY